MAEIVLDNFVVLEGLDGSGTTTQLGLLDEELNARSIPHFCTCEPTDGPVGRLLRSILRHEIDAHPRTTALLFAADRNEHLYEPGRGIVDRAGRGEIVVCDRYLFSSLAYQSLRVEFETVLALNRGFPLPRHLIFLDTPVETSQERLQRRMGGRDPELFERRELQERIRQGYLRAFELFRESGMIVHPIDGSAAPREIARQVWTVVGSLPIGKG